MQKKWYVIQTLSSHEEKVRKIIEKERKRWSDSDSIGQLKIPTYKEVTKTSSGAKKEVLRKSIPGYVFIELDFTESIYSKLRSIPGVMGFVIATGGEPQALSQEEIENIFVESDNVKEDQTYSRISYLIGDTVEILEGSFTTFKGKIVDINHEKGKIKVEIEIFGRPTSVELDYTQVNKS